MQTPDPAQRSTATGKGRVFLLGLWLIVLPLCLYAPVLRHQILLNNGGVN